MTSNDSHALRGIGLFTIGAKLKFSSEIVCLAAHTWHRFFAGSLTNVAVYDDHTYSAVCLLLSSEHYEKPVDLRDLVNVFVAVIHQPKNCILNERQCQKLTKSIIGAKEILLRVIDYKIGYHTTIGPEGQFAPSTLASSIRSTLNASPAYRPIISDSIKTTISSHRYLTHYLDSLCDLMNDKELAGKLCNVSWAYLCDFYWSSKVIQYKQEYLACASIEMALKTLNITTLLYGNSSSSTSSSKDNPGNNPSDHQPKRWYNVFCQELTEQTLLKLVFVMINEYSNLDRLFEIETSKLTVPEH